MTVAGVGSTTSAIEPILIYKYICDIKYLYDFLFLSINVRETIFLEGSFFGFL